MGELRHFNSRPLSLLPRVIYCGLLVGLALASRAAGPAPEYTVKAVFIFQFTNFVRWPDQDFSGPDAPFVIGVLGRDPFGGALDAAVKGGHVGTHPIVVRRFSREADAEKCQLLFVAAGDERVIRGRKLPALTVGETSEFAAAGGDIRMANEQGQIRLHINLRAVRAAGLTISSQLLRIAEVTDGS